MKDRCRGAAQYKRGVYRPGALLGPLGGIGQDAAGNWWDPNGDGLCVWAAYQPKGAASLAASYTDLTGNGRNVAPGVAPAWDAGNGWKFDGSSHYLVTPLFTVDADQSQTVIMQYSDWTGPAWRWWFGTASFHLLLRATAAAYNAWNGGGKNSISARVNNGNVAIAGNAFYLNGVDDGITIPVGAGGTQAIGIGGDGSGGNLLGVYCQAFAVYDCDIGAVPVAAVETAMAAL